MLFDNMLIISWQSRHGFFSTVEIESCNQDHVGSNRDPLSLQKGLYLEGKKKDTHFMYKLKVSNLFSIDWKFEL